VIFPNTGCWHLRGLVCITTKIHSGVPNVGRQCHVCLFVLFVLFRHLTRPGRGSLGRRNNNCEGKRRFIMNTAAPATDTMIQHDLMIKIHETDYANARSIVSIRPKPLCRPPLQFTFFSLPLAYRSTQLLNSLNWFRFTGRKYDNDMRITGRRCYCLLGSPAY